MLPSTTIYQTRQASLARKPLGKVLIRDYSKLIGDKNKDETPEIGGSAFHSLAVEYTPTTNMTVKSLSLFMKSDSAANEEITIEVREASAGAPKASAITNGTGKVLAFTDQAVGWRKAYFHNNFSLSSGTDYYVVAHTTGSTYCYNWVEDDAVTGGEWRQGFANGSSWATTTSGAALITKFIEYEKQNTGTITSITSSGASGTINVSAGSFTASAWDQKMLIIDASGSAGTGDSVGTSFYIHTNSISSFVVDADPDERGIKAGDQFYLEDLINYQTITKWTDFSIDDKRDRTINLAKLTLFNDKQKYYSNEPHGDTLQDGNDVIVQLAFTGTEYINQFRGYIQERTVQPNIANIKLQDVMGKLQRLPLNISGIDNTAYEKVVARICQRGNIPFLTDPTGSNTPSAVTFNESKSALTNINLVREALSWRLYGDTFGRARFRERKSAGGRVLALATSSFILDKGLILNKDSRNILNIVAATNMSGTTTFGDEVLIANYSGSAACATGLTVNFASAGVFTNIRWNDTADDGSVKIIEAGASRSTGKTAGNSGSIKLKVFGIGGTPDFNINVYGTQATISGTQFYVEKVDGESQNKIGANTTNKLVKNSFFLNETFADSFLDRVILTNGALVDTPTVKCRGMATLEVEDTIILNHPDVASTILWNITGINKIYKSGSFFTSFNLQDTSVREGDLRYDISLRFDTGLDYDT